MAIGGGFKNGVSWYAIGTTMVKVGFPEGQMSCRWCEFCKPETAFDRARCQLTWHMVYDPNASGLPEFCPLEIQNDYADCAVNPTKIEKIGGTE